MGDIHQFMLHNYWSCMVRCKYWNNTTFIHTGTGGAYNYRFGGCVNPP